MTEGTPQLLMTIGLPASGKTTWAEEQVRANPGRVVHVTKDQLRLMLNAGVFKGKKTESIVLAARDALIETFLAQGLTVIVDDTNFAPFHEKRLRDLAGQYGAEFNVQDFTHVPLEVCLERNEKRSARKRVPASVIHKMWDDYLAAAGQPAAHHDVVDRTERPDAVICDIDGTVARMTGRKPYDWHLVDSDEPVAAVISAVHAMAAAGTQILFMSGRDGCCREMTQEWLDKHVGIDAPLFMRAPGDNRRDSIVKRELFDAHVRDRFNVVFVLDDRDQVVELWRHDLGLPCFQVAEGAF